MKTLVAVALIFGLGALLGNKTADPPLEILRITHTRTVHDPAPAPAVKYRLPPACESAIELAEEIQRGALKLDAASTTTIDLIDKARIAATEGNDNELVEAENQLNRLQGQTSDSLHLITSNLWKFEKDRKACKK